MDKVIHCSIALFIHVMDLSNVAEGGRKKNSSVTKIRILAL